MNSSEAAPLGEFEFVPPLDLSSDLFSAQLAFSILHNSPLRLIDKERAHAAKIELKTVLGLSFEEFCVHTAFNWKHFKPIFSDLKHGLFVTRPTGTSPLIRLLRDHWLWQWYEITKIVEIVSKENLDSSQDIAKIFGGRNTFIGMTIGESVGKYLLVVGADMFSIDQFVQDKQHVRELVDEIHSALDFAWCEVKEKPFSRSLPNVLHSEETLFRAAVTRYPKKSTHVCEEVGFIAPMIRDLAHQLRLMDQCVSFSAITRLAALVSTVGANFRDQGVYPKISTSLTGMGDEKLKHIECKFVNGRYHFEQLDYPYDRTKEKNWLYEHRLETGVSFWRNQVYESVSILNRWLNAHLGAEVGLPGDFGERFHPAWHRLARFVASTFNCSQVALYRLDFSDSERPLQCFAALSNDTEPDDHRKMIVLAEHMYQLAGEPTRRESMAYKCVDSNTQEYAKGWDVALGNSSHTNGSYPPQNSEWENWGVSVMATPIRINGIPWGVIECVGDIPNAFSALVRSEIEELSGIISPFLFLNSITHYVDEFTNYISDESKSVKEKRTHIEENIDVLMMCSGCAVYSLKGANEVSCLFTSTQLRRRPQPSSVTSEDIEKFLRSEKTMEFYRNEDCNQFSIELQSSKAANAALVRLDNRQNSSEQNCILLLFPFPLRRELGWFQTYSALGGFLLSIVKLLNSEISWAQEIRPYMAHQMSSRARILAGRLNDLESVLEPYDTKNKTYQILYDMRNAIDNLRIYTQSMSAKDQSFKTVKQARMFVVETAIRDKKLEVENLDFRSAWQSAGYSRREVLSESKILIGELQDKRSGRSPEIRFLGGLLEELIGEVFDNCAKYSVFGDVVQGQLFESGGHTHLTLITKGPFIDEDEVGHIFEDGYRAQFAREHRSGNGVGKGLAYARHVMNLFRGDIDHTQELVAGTKIVMKGADHIARHKFTFTLPRSDDFKKVLKRIRGDGEWK